MELVELIWWVKVIKKKKKHVDLMLISILLNLCQCIHWGKCLEMWDVIDRSGCFDFWWVAVK